MNQNWKKRTVKQSLQEYAVLPVDCCLVAAALHNGMVGWFYHPLRLLIPFSYLHAAIGIQPIRSAVRCQSSWVAIDSVEEMGLGLLIAAFVLWLLGQITFDMTVNEILGKIIEAMTVAIGVSIGTAQLVVVRVVGG